MYIRDGKLPTGKGMFLWLLPRLVERFGSVQQLVAYLEGAGYAWVCIQAQHGHSLGCSKSYDPQAQIHILDKLVPLLKEANIEVHGWGYIFGNTKLAFLRNRQQARENARIAEAIERWGFSSWTINAEGDHKVKDGDRYAREQMVALRELLETHPARIDVPLGISSYRFVSSHGQWKDKHGFPFQAFADYCDFGAPQVYWVQSNYPVDQLLKSVREWRALRPGEDWPLVVAGTVYPHGSWWPTGAQLKAFNDMCKKLPEVIGVNYWELYYPFKYNRIDLASELASFQWPAYMSDDDPVDFPPNTIGRIQRSIHRIESYLEVIASSKLEDVVEDLNGLVEALERM
jgi:hypothetical protein